VFVGTFNGGFVQQGFAGAMVGVAIPALRHVPAARLDH
jgi:acetyl-CoA C-acetyltransferase